jgi:hypothetical protein
MGLILCATGISIHTKRVEFVNNPYEIQAPLEVVNAVDAITEQLEINDVYEVAVPTKAGLQINPWFNFMVSVINPSTKNCFILINPTWFLALPHEQQLHLLAHCFVQYKEGSIPLSMKVIPWLFIIFSFVAVLGLVRLLEKTKLATQPKWVVAILAGIIVTMCNLSFLNKLQTKLMHYAATKHNINLHRMAIEKTGNKKAAINTLESLDTSIAEHIQQGESFFTPHATLFKDLACKLKKNA